MSRNGPPFFRDRAAAGEVLGAALAERDVDVDVVLAIPRGGLPLGRAVADELGVPLDIVVASKLGAPGNPELAIGAVGSDGSVWIDEATVDALDIDETYIERERAQKAAAAQKKAVRYREDGAFELDGKRVAIVDDGVATGATAIAAVRLARSQGADHVVVAVPVGPPETVSELKAVADEVVCLETPSRFGAVGRFYTDFGQISDEEAMSYLA